VARLTRKELKKDPFLSVYYDDIVEFAQKNYHAIIAAVLLVVLAVLAVYSWRSYEQRQELTANALLGAALNTFNAYVGTASEGALGPGTQAFSTPAAKYQAALKQFGEVVEKYPRQKAAEIALYHVGVCQSQLGNSSAAVKTLEQAEHSSDSDIGSLARLALADELARTGKLDAAKNIYTQLAAHPTPAVPAATAWLALANADRASQPAAARQIYERLAKDYGSDTYVAETVKEQLSTLPK
jgi:predicted negative regulator of RcsB-dependent stress response